MSEELLSRADLSGVPEKGLLVVGFSGGADSTALSHWLLQKLGAERMMLAHVNHGLRGEEADRDEAAAGQFARRNGLRFAVFRADVKTLARERGESVEECGRNVRYEFFRSLLHGEEDRILTAHNADDNAETMLLNLARGTSLQGLCGIPPRRGNILRPLLRVSRAEIEAYCAANALSFVTDSSNLSQEYARNRVRLLVMPELKKLNPRFPEAAAQAAESLRRDWEFISGEGEKLLGQARTHFGLEACELLGAPESVRAAAIKLYLEREGCGRLEKKHLDAVLLCLLQGGGADLPGGVSVRCAQGVLSVSKGKTGEPFFAEVFPGETLLPGGKRLVLEKKNLKTGENPWKIHNLLFKNAIDYDIITGKLIARTRKEGDRFAPVGRKVTKSLKQVFQEGKVPPAERAGAVLLESGGELAFCEGAGVSERFRVTERTVTALVVRVLRDTPGTEQESGFWERKEQKQ